VRTNAQIEDDVPIRPCRRHRRGYRSRKTRCDWARATTRLGVALHSAESLGECRDAEPRFGPGELPEVINMKKAVVGLLTLKWLRRRRDSRGRSSHRRG
jgi:hypothetical protein